MVSSQRSSPTGGDLLNYMGENNAAFDEVRGCQRPWIHHFFRVVYLGHFLSQEGEGSCIFIMTR